MEEIDDLQEAMSHIPKPGIKVRDKQTGIIFEVFKIFPKIDISLVLKDKYHSVGYKVVSVLYFNREFEIVQEDISDEFSRRLFAATPEVREYLLEVVDIDKEPPTVPELVDDRCICNLIEPEDGPMSWTCGRHGRVFKI